MGMPIIIMSKRKLLRNSVSSSVIIIMIVKISKILKVQLKEVNRII